MSIVDFNEFKINDYKNLNIVSNKFVKFFNSKRQMKFNVKYDHTHKFTFNLKKKVNQSYSMFVSREAAIINVDIHMKNLFFDWKFSLWYLFCLWISSYLELLIISKNMMTYNYLNTSVLNQLLIFNFSFKILQWPHQQNNLKLFLLVIMTWNYQE